MAEVIFTGEVTGYGSYDNDPPGYDIAYPNARHPQTGTGTTSTCWGTAFGNGSWEYPLAMAGDINRHPAGTVAYDEVSKKYYEMVDYCQACQAPANPRLDLYVGGDLSPTTAKVNQVNNASSNLTRIPGSTQVGRRLILNPDPGKPVVLGPASGIGSGCGNVGPARTGGTSPPPSPLPPPGGNMAFGFARARSAAVSGSSGANGTNTRSFLWLSKQNYSNPITFKHAFCVTRQLRTGATPNTWEMPWLGWHNDAANPDISFNYFVAKTNGWELGIEVPNSGANADPNVPWAGVQITLASGNTPAFQTGRWYDVEITQNGSTVTVKIDGVQVANATDSRLRTSGRLMMYGEDCEIEYTDYRSPLVDTLVADIGKTVTTDGSSVLTNWTNVYLGGGSLTVVGTPTVAYAGGASPPPSPPPVPPPSPPPVPPPSPPPSGTGDNQVINIPALVGWDGNPRTRHDEVLSVVGGKIRISGADHPALGFTVPTISGRQYTLTFKSDAVAPDTAANVWFNYAADGNPVPIGGASNAWWPTPGNQTYTFTAGATSAEILIGTASPKVDISNVLVVLV